MSVSGGADVMSGGADVIAVSHLLHSVHHRAVRGGGRAAGAVGVALRCVEATAHEPQPRWGVGERVGRR